MVTFESTVEITMQEIHLAIVVEVQQLLMMSDVTRTRHILIQVPMLLDSLGMRRKDFLARFVESKFFYLMEGNTM